MRAEGDSKTWMNSGGPAPGEEERSDVAPRVRTAEPGT